MLEIKKVVNDVLEENTYILTINDESLIIDPGSNFLDIVNLIGNTKPLKILITHNHFDHIMSKDKLIDKYGIDIIDYNNLNEDEYNIGSFNFNVIYTPGHSSDSVTYYFKEDKIMFTGDFIFRESIGRCDLPTGSINQMNKSLDKIKKYDDDIKIYPGHGIETNLYYEKNNNSYMN